MLKKLLLSALMTCVTPQAFADNVNYNIFLMPDKTAVQAVKHISDQLQSVGVKSLYQQGYLPHVTLYLTEYPEKNLPALKKDVATIARQGHSFHVVMTGIKQTKGNWLMLNVDRNQTLQHLADAVTVAVEPLRARDPVLPDWVTHFPSKLASFKRYGSPNVFTNFDPHITLMPESDPHKLTQFMKKYGDSFQPLTFKAVGIGIAKVNENGQAKEKIVTYRFSDTESSNKRTNGA